VKNSGFMSRLPFIIGYLIGISFVPSALRDETEALARSVWRRVSTARDKDQGYFFDHEPFAIRPSSCLSVSDMHRSLGTVSHSAVSADRVMMPRFVYLYT